MLRSEQKSSLVFNIGKILRKYIPYSLSMLEIDVAVKWIACTYLYAVPKISSAALCSLHLQTDLCTCVGVARHLCLSFNCWAKPSVAAHHACVDGSSTRKLDVLAQPPVELPLEIWYVFRRLRAPLLVADYRIQFLQQLFVGQGITVGGSHCGGRHASRSSLPLWCLAYIGMYVLSPVSFIILIYHLSRILVTSPTASPLFGVCTLSIGTASRAIGGVRIQATGPKRRYEINWCSH